MSELNYSCESIVWAVWDMLSVCEWERMWKFGTKHGIGSLIVRETLGPAAAAWSVRVQRILFATRYDILYTWRRRELSKMLRIARVILLRLLLVRPLPLVTHYFWWWRKRDWVNDRPVRISTANYSPTKYLLLRQIIRKLINRKKIEAAFKPR